MSSKVSEPIYLTAMPKSGGTWLSRTLGDLLDSPVRGVSYAEPLGQEGLDRQGNFTVYQTHLTPDDGDNENHVLTPDPYNFSLPNWHGEKVIHLHRDPRDVAVSAMYYWGLTSIEEALEGVASATHPISYQYGDFIRGWERLPVLQISYCDLLRKPFPTLHRICDYIGAEVTDEQIGATLQRQAFATRRHDMEENGNNYPHGVTAQLTNLRKGEIGDWHKELKTRQQRKLAADYFNEFLIELGYERNTDWWERDEHALIQYLYNRFELKEPGEELCRTLYQLASSLQQGVIVELGSFVGRTAIALAWDSNGVSVTSVDEYSDHLDWAMNRYTSENEVKYWDNVRAARVETTLCKGEATDVAKRWTEPIGLWVWDISAYGRLLADWLAWRPYVIGRALLRDTYDGHLGAKTVLEYERTRGEFEVEREDLGITIIKRIHA